MTDSLQLISHLPLLDVGLPANVNQTFESLRKISTFDILGTHTFDFLSKLPDPTPHNSKFFALDYEGVFPIHNLSTMFAFTLVYIVCCTAYAILFTKCRKPGQLDKELKEGGEKENENSD